MLQVRGIQLSRFTELLAANPQVSSIVADSPSALEHRWPFCLGLVYADARIPNGSEPGPARVLDDRANIPGPQRKSYMKSDIATVLAIWS